MTPVRLLETFEEWRALRLPVWGSSVTVLVGSFVVAAIADLRSVYPDMPAHPQGHEFVALPYVVLGGEQGPMYRRLPPQLAGWLKPLSELRLQLPCDVEFGLRDDGTPYAEIL